MEITEVLDEKNQMMQTSAYLQFNWTDYRLVWDPEEHGGAKDLRFPVDKLWKPDVLFFTFKLFGSWTYNGWKLDLQPESNASLDTSDFVENGEWLLIDTPVKRTEHFYACCPEPFLDLKFFLHLRRRTLYYAVNIIIPSLLILLMTILGFALPVESGEKVTLEITILLSMCVFVNMVTQIIPSTSEAVPVIVVFFTCNMIIVSASVIFNVLILGLHYRTPDTHNMSEWTKVVLLNWLPWLLCMRRPGHHFSRTSLLACLRDKFWLKSRSQDTGLKEDVTTYGPVSERRWSFCEECDKLSSGLQLAGPSSDEVWKLHHDHTNVVKTDVNLKAMLKTLEKIYQSLLFITRRLERDEEEEDAKNDWKSVIFTSTIC